MADDTKNAQTTNKYKVVHELLGTYNQNGNNHAQGDILQADSFPSPAVLARFLRLGAIVPYTGDEEVLEHNRGVGETPEWAIGTPAAPQNTSMAPHDDNNLNYKDAFQVIMNVLAGKTTTGLNPADYSGSVESYDNTGDAAKQQRTTSQQALAGEYPTVESFDDSGSGQQSSNGSKRGRKAANVTNTDTQPTAVETDGSTTSQEPTTNAY